MAWAAILKALQMAQAAKSMMGSKGGEQAAPPPPWMIQGRQGEADQDPMEMIRKKKLAELQAMMNYQPYQGSQESLYQGEMGSGLQQQQPWQTPWK